MSDSPPPAGSSVFSDLAGLVAAKAQKLDAGQADKSNVFKSEQYIELDKEKPDLTREEMLAEFERRRKARSIVLPTDDLEVKRMLRKINEPICLFGEDPGLRRERLRTIMSLMTEEEKQVVFDKEESASIVQDRREEESTWYHEGGADLKLARIEIAKYSLPKAKMRIEKAKANAKQNSQDKNIKIQEVNKWVRHLTTHSSQFGDNRAISYCQFSPNSAYLATASWSGLCKLWTAPNCELKTTFRGHKSQCSCVAFHPYSSISQQPHEVNLASSCQDGDILLWGMEVETPLHRIEDCVPHRVSRVAFHPCGKYLAATCFDSSWRMYDLESCKEILFQEGHSKAVYDIGFQVDGSLALTGGLDAYGRVWDMRTGRCVMFLEGHQKGILSTSFAPNGFMMATGSQDNSCKIWDMRNRDCIYTIPAHSNLVSKARFAEPDGHFLITSSYDSTIKIWTAPSWQPLRTLRGHDSKIMCVDMSPDGNWICSASYDRTFKVWAPELNLIDDDEEEEEVVDS